MSDYSQFANVYDSLMGDVDYKARTKYIIKLFKRYGKMPTLLLDLACGTGGFSNQFALCGVEVIGVDMSEDMLAQARINSAELGTDVLYLCQRAEELDLYGTVDGAVCCLDSINHITDKATLVSALKKVSLFLEDDCLFIFDVNTPYKHREILGNNTFVFEEDDIFCVWQNNYNSKDMSVEISLDFFEKQGNTYQRYSEEFFERAYSQLEIKEMLKSSGFETVAVFEDMTEKNPTEKCEREIYIAKKVSN